MPLSLAVLAIGAIGPIARAGDLDPPAGPIAPTGKTLTEVEPRIAISADNTPGDADSVFRITQPGSYYLIGNVTGQSAKHGIQIEADGVSLDLNGFTLIGTAASLDGINLPAFRENVVIRNGHVRGWGESGIEARIDLGRIERITAGDNGGWGVDNGTGSFTTHIVFCEAIGNGNLVPDGGGIRGGSAAVITGCVSFGNIGHGIVALNTSIVTRCAARANSADGISVSTTSTVRQCTASINAGDGIEVSSDCLLAENVCATNGSSGDGAGIHVIGPDNRIEANNCTDSDRGIDIDGVGNIIIRNTCSGNTTNWAIAANNVYGPIIDRTAPASPAVSGNAAASALGSTDANANFTY
jgi:parallel beta-helix repeat protein